MPSKYQLITGLYDATIEKITQTPEDWKRFLRAAARNYKLPFNEQVLVYAQRPEATAVLQLERWNERFHRWVNAGSTGIAVPDSASERPRLKYYFDINDTHETRYSRAVPLWEMQPEYVPDIIEALENSFGELAEKETLAAALLSAADNLAADNLTDYYDQLAGMGVEIDEATYFLALKNSVAYMLMSRCGVEAEGLDFSPLAFFDGPAAVTSLGGAASAVAEMGLREIAATALSLQKNSIRTFDGQPGTVYNEAIPAEERTDEHDADLYESERVQHSRSGPAAPAGGEPGQVRAGAADAPAGAQATAAHAPAVPGDPMGAPAGDSAGRDRADGSDHRADGPGPGRGRGAQSQESNAVGGLDGQHPAGGGGIGDAGGYLQLSLFLSPEEQRARIEEAGAAKAAAFSISQQIIDEVLTAGGNEVNSPHRIVSYFKKDHSTAENAVFLKEEYGKGGWGFIFSGNRVSVWFNENGIQIAVGDTALNAAGVTLVTWEQAAKRIRELLGLGRYMPQSELDKVDAYELQALAGHLWEVHRDRAGGVVFFMDDELFQGDPSESRERIAELLAQPEQRQGILAGLRDFAAAYEQDNDILRYWFSERHLRTALRGVDDLQREPLVFTTDESASTARAAFITQDEIDALLTRDGHVEDGKYRIYAYFLQPHTPKEKADFLKKEYGIGGQGRTGFNESHNTKGLTYSRERNWKPYDKVLLTWPKVAKRIDELIAADRYMSQRELDHIPEYEKDVLAREAYSFFYDQQDIASRPYPYGMDFYDAIEVLRPQMDDPARVVEIVTVMAAVMETTAETDRYYETMRRAFDDLRAYRDGTFSLFTPGIPTEKEKSAAHAPEAATPAASVPMEYRYGMGSEVHLDDGQYVVFTASSSEVRLYNPRFPIVNRVMPREEFEALLAENPANDYLLEPVEEAPEAPVEEPAPTPEPLPAEPYSPPQSLLAVEAELDRKVDLMREHPDYAKIKEAAGYWKTWRNMSHRVGIAADALVNQINALDDQQAVAWFSGVPWDSWREALDIGDFEPLSVKIRREGDPRPEIPQAQRHNYCITDDALGHGGTKAKYKANIDAITLLKALDAEGRLATPAEQETLSRYVGWGGIPQAFDPDNAQWAGEYQELKSLLTDEEYTAARTSTLNAHYTSPTVVKAIYKAVANMGFTQGNVLEPSCGIGNFFGLVPESMSASKLYGVELDPITGRIARQLYQQNNISVQGFESTDLPDSFFDLAIGNVPFGDYSVADRRYDKHKFLIHDYFFAKALDKVRPGGVVAFITSKGTLDKQNPAVRRYIAQRAELLGAIRLPNTAFKANAGTEVTTDIIFLQKRDRAIETDPDWVHLGQGGAAERESFSPSGGNERSAARDDADGIPINSYFVDHPEMVLGEMVTESTAYGHDTTCNPFPDRDLADLLDEAVQNIHAEITDYERDHPQEDESIPADPSVRNFSYTICNGKIYYRENSRMVPQELSVTARSRVTGMIGIRDCTRQLIEWQTEGAPDEIIQREQARLNSLYDAYTKKYGLLSDRANGSVFREDSSYPLLCSLEILDEDGKLKAKADMFTKRTIRPNVPVTHVDTAAESLAVSIAEKARVDLAYMSELSGIRENDLIRELEGVIFFDCGTSSVNPYVTADEYLSGNVREKLKTAMEAQKAFPDGRYDSNIRALEASQPKDLTAAEISVRLGATWVPPEDIRQFIFELMGTPKWMRDDIKVGYSHITAEWGIEGWRLDRSNVKGTNTYGTRRKNAYEIIEATLNLRDVRVFDRGTDAEGREISVLNKKETTIAQAKQEAIKQAFQDWIWRDPNRRARLVQSYNERFNSTRPREYDGRHINFVGMNPEISLRPHQVNAIARILYGGNTLLAHEVGAGKTYEMVAAAMESKRLGLSHKSMIVVPNHIIEQFAAEWLQLYPSANILVATKKDFETRNRRKFCGRIATGDYDAVIIGHSQFEKIPMSTEFQRRVLQDQLNEILWGIEEAAKEKGERFTVKQLEKTRKSIEAKLKKLNDQSRKDDVVTFEQLGVDRVFVDEAHNYKNLFLFTKMGNVAGIAQTEAQKSSDLFMKCRYLDEQTGGRGVVFATGTPISNSMVELYSIMRYLQYDTLERNELHHFDAWASTFGETVTAIELAPEGSGYRAKTRFAKFYNLPELMAIFREVADIQTADMLNLPVPKANFHIVNVPPSDLQKEMVQGLAERAEKVRKKAVDPRTDNMLRITNDGRKLALDQRLMNPMLPDHPDSKVNACVKNVYDIWERTAEKRSAQLVFCDLSTPKGDGSFNVYDDIRAKLIARGVPEAEIAFIHDADSEVKKKELFAKVRAGTVRVLLGSTAKMGAGTNVQDRLIALHDLDVPWRPSDLAQRLGRIQRQGNSNPEIEVFRYVTEGTFDAYSYQLVESKQKFISQVMTSCTPLRCAEDVDEQALSYAEIKALASGNPLIIEKCNLEMQVGRLQLLKGSFLSQRYDLEDKALRHLPSAISYSERQIAARETDAALAVQTAPASAEHFSPMVIHDVACTTTKDAGSALLEACAAVTSKDLVPIGTYRGFSMEVSFDRLEKEYHLTLRGQGNYPVSLGVDVRGNITRIDNALGSLSASLETERQTLADLRQQLAAAKEQMGVPFPQEAELAEKSAKLAKVNAALNLDHREPEVLGDDAPEEGEAPGPKHKKAELEL